MNELEQSRLNDFKKILTYHIVTKICYHFKGDYDLYYKAPLIWEQWQARKLKYSPKIYKYIVAFNSTSLTSLQRQHIFGKDENNHYVKYQNLIEQDPSIKVFNKGTIYMSKRRFALSKRYQLPYEYIKSIFNDKQLLFKVKNAKSDFYTDRQRRLIFTQIIGQQHYHYKTNKQLIEDITEEERIKTIIDEFIITGDLNETTTD